MRIESQPLPQSVVQSSKSLDQKGLKENNSGKSPGPEQFQPLTISPFGPGGTYSVNSLKAAVEYHVKFLAVAENNMIAINHPPTVPGEIMDRFRGIQRKSA